MPILEIYGLQRLVTATRPFGGRSHETNGKPDAEKSHVSLMDRRLDRNYESLQEGAPTKKANAHIEHENRADP